MDILVTGGAGFIGSHVCNALVERGDSVVCVDNFNDFYSPKIKEKNIKELLLKDNFKLYKVDIRDSKELKKVFEENKIAKVIHLAAMAGVRNSIKDPVLYEDINIKGTINLLELSKQFKVENFVFGSSSSVYGTNKKLPFSESDAINNIISPYGATKRAGELLCYVYHNLYKMNITCLRFFTVYGPRNRPDMGVYKFTKAIEKGEEITLFGDGTSKRDYTYVGDIVSGVIAALDKKLGFEIINLGNSKTVELSYLISLIEKVLGKEADISEAPAQLGDVPITFADISKAKKLLNWEPKTSIEQGIKKFIEWYKKEKQ